MCVKRCRERIEREERKAESEAARRSKELADKELADLRASAVASVLEESLGRQDDAEDDSSGPAVRIVMIETLSPSMLKSIVFLSSEVSEICF